MTTLAAVSIGVGLLYIVLHTPLWARPAWAQRVVGAFPRHVWAGRILAAPVIAWSAQQVWVMPLGWFDAYKWTLYGVAPALYILILIFMEELLAPRALGGLLLLAAAPVLEASSATNAGGYPWRLVIVALAYVWVIAGMVLVLSPYRFRKSMAVLCATPGRCRAAGGAGTAIGALLIALGLTVF